MQHGSFTRPEIGSTGSRYDQLGLEEHMIAYFQDHIFRSKRSQDLTFVTHAHNLVQNSLISRVCFVMEVSLVNEVLSK